MQRMPPQYKRLGPREPPDVAVSNTDSHPTRGNHHKCSTLIIIHNKIPVMMHTKNI